MTFYLPQAPLKAAREIADWMNTVKARLEQNRILNLGVAITSSIQGDIIYQGGTAGWSRLAAGVNGQFLQTQGTSSNPKWGNVTSVITAGTGIAITGTSTGTVAFATVANNTILSNISGGTAVPSPNGYSAALDAFLGTSAGNFAYRGTSGWTGSLGPTAGLSTTIAKPGGTIFDHYADAGNSGTGETDLYTDTLAANILGTNGDKIVATYAGIFVSSASATREIKAYFGGTQIFDTGALSISAGSDAWQIDVFIIRESSSVVRCSVVATTAGASLNIYDNYTRVTGLTLSGTNVLKITGQAAGVGAATNDIVAKQGYGIWQSAA